MMELGIVLVIVGLVGFLVGAGLHLKNIKSFADGEPPTGRKFIVPFAVMVPTVPLFVIGAVLILIVLIPRIF